MGNNAEKYASEIFKRPDPHRPSVKSWAAFDANQALPKSGSDE